MAVPAIQHLVNAVAVDVVVRPGAPVNRGPGSGRLRVEGARRGIVLVRVDGDSRVALGLEVSAPRLVGLEPVATSRGVVPVECTSTLADGRTDLKMLTPLQLSISALNLE